MPMKKENKPAEEAPPPAAEAAPEDPPIVKQLKEIDDKYLALEREYEKEVEALQKRYTELQAPLLTERSKKLAEGSDVTGTPALKGFWSQAMTNVTELEDMIEEWDEPVLEYLKDITKDFLDSNDLSKGFKLMFHFAENPFFENEMLWKEYLIVESSPYTGDHEPTEIKASEIIWREGKDVTVEITKKKVKGGGAKKKKQAKEKEEPRASFFRSFFKNMKHGMEVPDDIVTDELLELREDDENEDDDEIVSMLMENDYEMAMAFRDQLIPFAVRWYTGEARPEDDEEDDDDDEDDVEDDDDDDDDDEDGGDEDKDGVEDEDEEDKDADEDEDEDQDQHLFHDRSRQHYRHNDDEHDHDHYHQHIQD